MNQPSLSVPSFAKINWNLQILGRRADGYHEISTLLQTISLHDDLHFEVNADGAVSVSCSDAELPIDGNNLIVRAANALKNRYQLTAGVRVALEKRIPTQAGLGGASSNAAITLLALAHLWRVETNADVLMEIASTLGSDVPFFLVGGCGLATGTGTLVLPLPEEMDSDPRYLVIIKPNANVSTPVAYSAIDSTALTTSHSEPILTSSRAEGDLRDSSLLPLPDSLKNDFESVIFDIEPEIRRTKEALMQAGARGALLAGSGSSVFGIFDSSEDQRRAVEQIQLEHGWRLFSCVTLSRNEYIGAVGSWSVPFLRSFKSGSEIGA